jgi:uncharacterized protein (DUF2147 family)
MNGHALNADRCGLFCRWVLAVCLALSLASAWAASGAAPTAAPVAAMPVEPLASDSPVGLWETISDTDGKAKSHVRITEVNGELIGVVETILDPTHAGRRCERCSDERKDQLILGMTILRHAHRDDNGALYIGGRILDPENGKVYACRLSVVDHGAHLHVRGYIGIPLFGRTQTWNRLP